MGSLAFFLRRVLHRWQTLLMLFLSVTLATGLLASGPLLVSTVLSFALPYKLRSVSPLNSNLRLTVYDSGENNAYQELDEKITSLVEQHLGEYNPQIVTGGGSNWMFPWYLETLNNDQQVNLRFYRGIEEHSRLIAGEWPPEQALQGDVIYAAITESLAEAYTLQVGERLPLSKKDTEEHPSLWLEVTGVIQARKGR